MELTFSWLYGASQPQESACCGLPVYPVASEQHKFWCDGHPIAREVAWPGLYNDPRAAYSIPQRYMLGGSET